MNVEKEKDMYEGFRKICSTYKTKDIVDAREPLVFEIESLQQALRAMDDELESRTDK